MGIKLDWQVESDAGRVQVAEQPESVVARTRRSRRLRIVLLVTIMLVAAGFAAAKVRLWQIDQQLRQDLEATIAAETLALRIGDRTAFLSQQATTDGWRDVQAYNFERYINQSPDINVTGEILNLDITGDEALVELAVETADGVATAEWVYARTSKGWRHAASLNQPWGIQQAEAESITLYYDLEQAELADALEAYLNAVWEVACETTACETPPPLTVNLINNQLSLVQWNGDSEITIFTEETAPPMTDWLVLHLDRELAAYWARNVLGPSEWRIPLWAKTELERWLRFTFNTRAHGLALTPYDPGVTPSPLFYHLSAAFDTEIVPTWASYVRQGETSGDALHAAMQDRAVRLNNDEELEHYLHHFLRAEAFSRDAYGQSSREQTYQIFFEAQDSPDLLSTQPIGDWYLSGIISDSIEVLSIHEMGAIIWVFTRFEVNLPNGLTTLRSAYLPFRYEGSLLTRGYPQVEEWGPVQQTRTTTTIVSYHSADADAVEDSLSFVDPAVRQISDDLGINELPNIRLTVTPLFPQEGQVSNDTVQMYVVSPYIQCCLIGLSDEEFLRLNIVMNMTVALAQYVQVEADSDLSLPYTFGFWESERLGVTLPPDWQYPVPTADVNTEPLSALWLIDDSDSLQMLAMFDAVEARFGTTGIASLVQHGSVYEDIDAWLGDSLGISPGEIESLWREKLLARIAAQ